LVPDIGGFKDVSVIEVLVKDGQQIDKEAPLITLETEKAAMDVPAPAAGRIAQVKLKQGDKVSEGSLILLLETTAADTAAAAEGKPAATAPAPAPAPGPAVAAAPPAAPAAAPAAAAPPAPASPAAPAPPAPAAAPAVPAAARAAPVARAAATIDEAAFSKAYASPSVRKFARELGADLGQITGTGPKGRITQDDVKAHVKRILAVPMPAAPVAAGTALPKVPEVDFAKFGAVEVKPLSRIQRISGARLQASWINLPHVTQYDESDITDLEAVRAALKDKATQEGVKLTPLVFIIKACIAALQKFPRFNASLDASGENLVLKKYFHIGFAADTANGLVVPVIRDAERLDIYQLARALGEMSEKARAGKLKAAEMQGGCFTVSSLGGIGGTAFTPIINAPEVAILGVAKSSQKPVYERGGFIPRLMLPLCLSYDHRVIDGAEAARFIVFLSKTLSDVKALV
jgi:pyruvate dehydrogenase E2 component (dihydrolipoamide acetyltransferase)